MNLVISGPIDDTLRNMVVALSKPRRVVSLHARADRLEGADDGATIKMQVAALCDAARVDHAYIAEGVRFADFKLLAMDMDSTLITIECIDEIADFAGKKKEVAAITEAAMRGEMDFGESLKKRVALLEGMRVDVLSQIYNDRLKLTGGAINLLKACKKSKIYTILLSGGFTYFTDRLKNSLDFDEAHANILKIKDKKLTGKVCESIVDAATKARIVLEGSERINSIATIVIGDGANDIEMMKYSSTSVAFHGKPLIRRAATACIDFGDLSVVLDYYAN